MAVDVPPTPPRLAFEDTAGFFSSQIMQKLVTDLSNNESVTCIEVLPDGTQRVYLRHADKMPPGFVLTARRP